MDLFGGRKVDRAQEARRVRETQELIRTIAGNVDENQAEMARLKEMMRAKQPQPVPVAAPKAEVRNAPAYERPLFCTVCGSRLPEDGSGCVRCSARSFRVCPYCGTRAGLSDRYCPACRRFLPVDQGREGNRPH